MADQLVSLEVFPTHRDYSFSFAPHPVLTDPETGKRLIFLYQPVHVACPDHLCPLQKPLAGRVFFKWIKQHLRIKPSTAP